MKKTSQSLNVEIVWHIKIGFFIGVQNQKNEKNVEKAQKNCKILQD